MLQLCANDMKDFEKIVFLPEVRRLFFIFHVTMTHVYVKRQGVWFHINPFKDDAQLCDADLSLRLERACDYDFEAKR